MIERIQMIEMDVSSGQIQSENIMIISNIVISLGIKLGGPKNEWIMDSFHRHTTADGPK